MRNLQLPRHLPGAQVGTEHSKMLFLKPMGEWGPLLCGVWEAFVGVSSESFSACAVGLRIALRDLVASDSSVPHTAHARYCLRGSSEVMPRPSSVRGGFHLEVTLHRQLPPVGAEAPRAHTCPQLVGQRDSPVSAELFPMVSSQSSSPLWVTQDTLCC